MTEWLGVAAGSTGLITAVAALVTLLQNRRQMRANEARIAAEATKLAADTVGSDVTTLRGIIAEIRVAREEDRRRIERLELVDRARLRYEAALSEFIAEHWRQEHPGETPRPPTFQYVE